MPAVCPAHLKLTPPSSCVQIPDTKYTFSCTFQGEELSINGREPKGNEEQVFFPKVTERPQKAGWSNQDCVISFPSAGVWRVIFWIDGEFCTTQTIVAGATLKPTSEERIAFAD